MFWKRKKQIVKLEDKVNEYFWKICELEAKIENNKIAYEYEIHRLTFNKMMSKDAVDMAKYLIDKHSINMGCYMIPEMTLNAIASGLSNSSNNWR